MSSDPIIKVEGVSKQYLLNKSGTPPSDTLYATISGSLRQVKNILKRRELEEFWALRDVSFNIGRGDRVGIIGRNGAGKSTLLKILSRITPPTKGRIEITGRLASLLEVGTGFHGDLSGRENIYLNGSILGMSKREIDRKFDEIVAFSEVEQFIDTPVKRYSSGMYVKLAFAVAAHLDPEILIVDEVLAVGDAAFQKKCLGKMEDVSTREGRTILFVSHNMDAVQKLCNTGILLHKGQLLKTGSIFDVLSTYVDNNSLSNGYFEIAGNQVDNYQQLGQLLSVSVLDASGNIAGEVVIGKAWKVKVTFRIDKAQESFVIGFGLQSVLGNPINTSWSEPQRVEPGTYEATFENSELQYNSGQYKIAVGLSNNLRSYCYNDSEAFIVISEAGQTEEENRLVNKSSGMLLNQLPYAIQKIA